MSRECKMELHEIVGEFKCPKDFVCYKSGFEILCKAKDVGRESFLLCKEKKPWECKFSLAVDYEYICECPLRIYIAKKLKK